MERQILHELELRRVRGAFKLHDSFSDRRVAGEFAIVSVRSVALVVIFRGRAIRGIEVCDVVAIVQFLCGASELGVNIHTVQIVGTFGIS